MFCVLRPLQTLYINAYSIAIQLHVRMATVKAEREAAQDYSYLHITAFSYTKYFYLGWLYTSSLENNPECQMHWCTAKVMSK